LSLVLLAAGNELIVVIIGAVYGVAVVAGAVSVALRKRSVDGCAAAAVRVVVVVVVVALATSIGWAPAAVLVIEVGGADDGGGCAENIEACVVGLIIDALRGWGAVGAWRSCIGGEAGAEECGAA